ncbi:MAG: hypothetical protein AAGG47_19395 [Pseudomonadota bacterium]
MTDTAAQLGFDALLTDADTENRNRVFARETAHLPATLDEAVPCFRGLIEKNHAAMLAADEDETRRLHDEARRLASKVNGGHPGILADEQAPGSVLARETAAKPGTVPLWGQTGDFVVELAGMAVRVEMEGLFGIGSGWSFWPGFSAHAVDLDKPFLSETGYRSFLGIHADPRPGMTPDTFAVWVVEAYVARELGGALVPIAERYKR